MVTFFTNHENVNMATKGKGKAMGNTAVVLLLRPTSNRALSVKMALLADSSEEPQFIR